MSSRKLLVPAIRQRHDATQKHDQITATHAVIWIDHEIIALLGAGGMGEVIAPAIP